MEELYVMYTTVDGFSDWMGEVIYNLEILGDLCTSDAQGIANFHKNIVIASWKDQFAPKKVARLLNTASKEIR
jgi:hypothetical protein